ncbi:MAG: transcriptional repressor [Bacteroidales bacterium]|nr:transcriptional repressor [Bacteroidales bacterium]
MDDSVLIGWMERHGVKPTANRIVIARSLAAAGRPMSMSELEAALETIDKSNVFRTLQVFREAHLVHVLEDTGGGARYELCHSRHDDEDDDVHVHFYCEKCHRTLCLEDTPVPQVTVPEGFEPDTVSYLVKGICPDCRHLG